MTIQTSSVGLAFDPSGTRLATSNIEAGVAEIWDVASGKKLVTLAGHSGQVNDVAWDPDPDRDRIATASSDTTVRLWNATTGVPELVLHGHTSPVWHVRFSADGSRLASASLDGSVRVWALDLDDLIEIATNKVTRTLTDAECRQFLHLAECSPEALESPAASSSTGGSPTSAPSRGPPPSTPPNPFKVLDHFSRSVTGVVTPVPGSSPEGIGLAVGPDGFLYVADLDQKVSVVDPTTGKRIRSWGRPGTGNGEFGDDLLTIAVASDGRVYVLDRANGRIEVFAPDGTYQRQMGGFGDAEGQFHDIRFLTMGEDGSVYVPDWDTATITKFDEEGAFVWRVGGEDAPDPDLQHGVYSLTVMKDGNILATWDEGGTALLLDPSDGSVIGHWPGAELIGDSGEPSVDAAGNVYVYQYVPRAIQIFSPEGTLLGGVYFEDAIYEDYELYPAPVFTSDGHGWSFDQTLGLVELEIDLPSPSAAPTASPLSVLEGTWTTAEITCDQLLATMHEAGFTDAQITAGNWACSQPVEWRLRFLGDSFAQFDKQGDGAWELGSGASFRLIDDHTLFLTDGQQTLSFTLVGDVLTFSSISGATADLDGQVHGAAIFLTTPFTKDP